MTSVRIEFDEARTMYYVVVGLRLNDVGAVCGVTYVSQCEREILTIGDALRKLYGLPEDRTIHKVKKEI